MLWLWLIFCSILNKNAEAKNFIYSAKTDILQPINARYGICWDKPNPVTSAPNGVSFATVGDWGAANSASDQTANQLNAAASITPFSYILSLGDNFYEYGVSNYTDLKWINTFNFFFNRHFIKDVPVYNALGNHDWRGNPWAQIAQHYTNTFPTWKMPNYWYTILEEFSDVPDQLQSNPFATGMKFQDVQIQKSSVASSNTVKILTVVLDTNVLLKDDVSDPIVPYIFTEKLVLLQMKFLEDTLEKASKFADWIFIVGHHHLFSAGKRGYSYKLIALLVPVIKKYFVDAYFNGHEHVLQLFEINKNENTKHSFFTSGSAAKHSKVACHSEECIFSTASHGFTSHIVTRDKLYSAFVNEKGTILYAHERSPNVKPHIPDSITLDLTEKIYLGPPTASPNPFNDIFEKSLMAVAVSFTLSAILTGTSLLCIMRKIYNRGVNNDLKK